MNFNLNNHIDFEQELRKKIGMIHDDVDKDLDDMINDDPELRDLIKKSETKKKKTIDVDDQYDDCKYLNVMYYNSKLSRFRK